MHHNLRKELFAHYYIACGCSGKRAAVKAGYSKKSAASKAAQLLKDPDVQAIIDTHKEEVIAKCTIQRDAVIEQLKVVAFSNLRDYMAMNRNGSLRYKIKEEIRGPEATAVKAIRSNVKGETVSIELHDKLEAISILLEMSTHPKPTPLDPVPAAGPFDDLIIRDPCSGPECVGV